MKKHSLKVQDTVLSKTLQDLSISDRQPLRKMAAHQEYTKTWQFLQPPKKSNWTQKPSCWSVLQNTQEQPPAPAL